MDGSVQIAKIFGIPLYIHFTFLLVIPLLAWIIGAQIELTVSLLTDIFGVVINPEIVTAGWMPYILGAIVAIGLFVGVFIHELAHSLVARQRGITIHSITLLILGGVSSMEEEMPDPVVELPMALAGPLTSLGLGLWGCSMVYAIDMLGGTTPLTGLAIFVVGYLGILNILLFAFNLIPAFPMDGGRVLRSFLAKRMPLHRATRIAADVGRGFAVIFGIVGFFMFNPILIIIAFFIYIGASQESRMIRYNVLLQDLTVADAMTSPVITVPPGVPLSEVIEMMYDTRHLGFPVEENGRLQGIVTLNDIHAIPSVDREAMQVQDAMTRKLVTLGPRQALTDALRLMARHDIGRIPVVSDGELEGIITRTDILRVMEIKEEVRGK